MSPLLVPCSSGISVEEPCYVVGKGCMFTLGSRACHSCCLCALFSSGNIELHCLSVCLNTDKLLSGVVDFGGMWCINTSSLVSDASAYEVTSISYLAPFTVTKSSIMTISGHRLPPSQL